MSKLGDAVDYFANVVLHSIVREELPGWDAELVTDPDQFLIKSFDLKRKGYLAERDRGPILTHIFLRRRIMTSEFHSIMPDRVGSFLQNFLLQACEDARQELLRLGPTFIPYHEPNGYRHEHR